MLAEILEGHPVGQCVLEELHGGLRKEDLPTVRASHEARGTVHGRAVVVAVAQFGFTGVESHADSELADLAPVDPLQLELPGERGVECVASALNTACTPSPVVFTMSPWCAPTASRRISS
jgi:hypothetical protein